ncbi:hypothetical protein BD410DRAFT_843979 [Rickenella mellea]|uniref:F-box domain-containing protein n=1 Tax=Rickenella mellea TaxID=50990 RepID=A0A4Y7PNK9_9AGAM|nr:hypothetical protein BD410DRAFT_843979 [Rickenella mellea]
MFICDLRVMALVDRLLRTSSSDSGPCETVKFVFVDTDAAFKARMASRLADLLRLCRNLRGFSWINHSQHYEDNSYRDEEVIDQIPGHIQFFGWSGRVSYANLSTFLCDSSASLRIVHIAKIQHDWAFPIQLPTATFPYLTDLRVDQSYDPLKWLSGWSTPLLCNLYLSHLSIDRGDRVLERTLSSVARTLRYLRFGHGLNVNAPLLSKILHACPHLQEFYYHLVHTIGQQSPWSSNLTHSSLKVITLVWYISCTWTYSDLRNYFRNISKTTFPLVDMIEVKPVTYGGSGEEYMNISLRRLSDDFSSAEIIVTPANNSPL